MASITSSSLVVRRLYRNLLRTAQPFTETSSKARVLNSLLHRTGIDDHIVDWEKLVSSTPTRTKDEARDLSVSYAESSREDESSHKTFQRLFRRLLREVVAGRDGVRKLSWPSQVNTNTLRHVIRREFRDNPFSQSIHFDSKARLRVAFTAIKELNKKLSLYEELEMLAPEPVPEQAALNVSTLPTFSPSSYLRPGAFLVSHPYMNDTFFANTVICILEHNADMTTPSATSHDDGRGQTCGVIINRVSLNGETGKNRTLKEAFEEHLLPGKLADVFGDSVVREGGPVHVSLMMLHSLGPASGDLKIGGTIIPLIPDGDESPALYSDKATYFDGEIFKAMNAVEEGSMDRDDVSFFVGASTWAPGQLESEVANGYWIPCRGLPEMALTGICEHETTTSSRRPLADLWLSMMSACGSDEAKLAHLFYHEEIDENSRPCDAFDDDDDLYF